MAVDTGDVRSASRLAGLLLRDVERIAERVVARMQELLPSYARVPRDDLTPVVLANVRSILEAIRDPAPDERRAQATFTASGEARVRAGITSDDMLRAWPIAQDVVLGEAHAVADASNFGKGVLLDFLEALLRWGEVAMRASAAAYRQVEMGELARLAEEQAALRRVATMVATGRSPEEVFVQVAEEVGRLFGVETAAIQRYEPEGEATVVGSWGTLREAFQVGSRLPLDGDSVIARVYRTGRQVRVDDYEQGSGLVVAGARRVGLRCGVGSPIVVNGRLWGALGVATSRAESMPADAESRLAGFTELVATAIANVQARSDLAASRARIVATADEERRRVVRDLHDGAQQRLVHTVVMLKLARRALERDADDAAALLDEALEHAQTATDELRELSHGILPSVLTHGGLRAGVHALASRMSIPVEIDIATDRLPHGIEATAYFVVAEALTNVVKHSRARRAAVSARVEGGALNVEVRDDGAGGARADGPGLVGLCDRLAVLEGSLQVESPAGGGTVIAASMPVG